MEHTLVGVWVVEIRYPDRPRVDRGSLLFHPSGSMSWALSEYTAHAVWSPSGDREASIRGVRPVGPNEGFVGMYELQANAIVSADGSSCEITAVQRRPRPDGTSMELHMAITGTRLTIGDAAGV